MSIIKANSIYLFTLLVLFYSCNNSQELKVESIKDEDGAKAYTEPDGTKVSKYGEPDYSNVHWDDFSECLALIEDIVVSSSKFKEVVKGIEFGTTLEGSPNAERDAALEYSETFDFNVHETKSEHQAVLARFSFDPATGQLYEFDMIEYELIPIEADKNLLKRLKTVCK